MRPARLALVLGVLLTPGCGGGQSSGDSSEPARYANMTREEARAAAQDAGEDLIAQFEAETGE